MPVLLRERGGGLPDGAPTYDYDGLGMRMGQCPGRSVQNCPCSPHFLPQPSKKETGRGSGGATVLSDKCSCVSGGPCCHDNACCFSPLAKGETLPVFSFFLFLGGWFLSFAFFWQSSLLLRADLRDKFSGANLRFAIQTYFLDFSWVLLIVVRFVFVFFAPGHV